MPGKNGYEVAQYVKQIAEARAHSGRAADRRVRAGRSGARRRGRLRRRAGEAVRAAAGHRPRQGAAGQAEASGRDAVPAAEPASSRRAAQRAHRLLRSPRRRVLGAVVERDGAAADPVRSPSFAGDGRRRATSTGSDRRARRREQASRGTLPAPRADVSPVDLPLSHGSPQRRARAGAATGAGVACVADRARAGAAACRSSTASIDATDPRRSRADPSRRRAELDRPPTPRRVEAEPAVESASIEAPDERLAPIEASAPVAPPEAAPAVARTPRCAAAPRRRSNFRCRIRRRCRRWPTRLPRCSPPSRATQRRPTRDSGPRQRPARRRRLPRVSDDADRRA